MTKWHIKYPYSYNPGSPQISCKISELYVDDVLLDTGASVNMLPYSAYLKIANRVLVKDNTVLNFWSIAKREVTGIASDIMIQLGDFYYVTDFLVMKEEETGVDIVVG